MTLLVHFQKWFFTDCYSVESLYRAAVFQERLHCGSICMVRLYHWEGNSYNIKTVYWHAPGLYLLNDTTSYRTVITLLMWYIHRKYCDFKHLAGWWYNPTSCTIPTLNIVIQINVPWHSQCWSPWSDALHLHCKKIRHTFSYIQFTPQHDAGIKFAYIISKTMMEINHWSLGDRNSIWKIESSILVHDHVIKWKRFPRYWPFVSGIHRSPMDSPHEGPVTRDLMFSFMLV